MLMSLTLFRIQFSYFCKKMQITLGQFSHV